MDQLLLRARTSVADDPIREGMARPIERVRVGQAGSNLSGSFMRPTSNRFGAGKARAPAVTDGASVPPLLVTA